ncbi:hypothetical protein [Streptomyces sp. NPDC005125]
MVALRTRRKVEPCQRPQQMGSTRGSDHRTAVGARLPGPDRGLLALEYTKSGYGSLEDLPPGGPIPEHIIEETEEELDLLCKELVQLGVVVRRSQPVDHSVTVATPDWQSQGCFDYCPRDSMLAIGDILIEVPMVMKRRNMKVNDWEDLVAWLHEEQLDVFAELIWGAPGETVESFVEGYDRLARRVSRIAVYPLILLPNTDFLEKKDLFGIKTVRSDIDDFEYLLSHDTVTLQENQRMQRFVLWARVFGELAVFRHIWAPMRVLAGMTQSQVLRNFEAWIAEVDDPAAVPMRSFAETAMNGVALSALGMAVEYLYGEPDAKRLLQRWWNESIRPLLSAEMAPVLDEVFRYDILTQPVYERSGSESRNQDLPLANVRGADYYVRRGVELAYDVLTIESELRADRIPDLSPSRRSVTFTTCSGLRQRSTRRRTSRLWNSRVGRTIRYWAFARAPAGQRTWMRMPCRPGAILPAKRTRSHATDSGREWLSLANLCLELRERRTEPGNGSSPL